MRECNGADVVRVTLKGTRDGLTSLGVPYRIVLSREPETTRFPSCENTTEVTWFRVALKGTGDGLASLGVPDPDCVVV